eukprot:s411_g13.t1
MPPTGGETDFADLAAAYEALPTDLQERWSQLASVNAYSGAVHPLVHRHPISGRKVLFLHLGQTGALVSRNGTRRQLTQTVPLTSMAAGVKVPQGVRALSAEEVIDVFRQYEALLSRTETWLRYRYEEPRHDEAQRESNFGHLCTWRVREDGGRSARQVWRADRGPEAAETIAAWMEAPSRADARAVCTHLAAAAAFHHPHGKRAWTCPFHPDLVDPVHIALLLSQLQLREPPEVLQEVEELLRTRAGELPPEGLVGAASAFVRYGLHGTFVDDPNHESGVGFRRNIIDVNEFQIAQALLAGQPELLSQEVESRHLFTMCMQFGHEETASEMLRQGVPGCKVEAFHLGPYALQPKFIGEPLELLLGI